MRQSRLTAQPGPAGSVRSEPLVSLIRGKWRALRLLQLLCSLGHYDSGDSLEVRNISRIL